MKKATLTAAGALGDFLKTTNPLDLSFELQPSVKDVIESQEFHTLPSISC